MKFLWHILEISQLVCYNYCAGNELICVTAAQNETPRAATLGVSIPIY
jgi:hypothetical protein